MYLQNFSIQLIFNIVNNILVTIYNVFIIRCLCVICYFDKFYLLKKIIKNNA